MTSPVTRWAFLDTETGDWIEVIPEEITEKILGQIAGIGEEILLLEPRDQFDPCLRGVVRRFNQTFALYSREAVLAAIAADMTGSEEEVHDMAVEHFEFNVIGGWVGDGTPAYLIEEDPPA